MNLDRFPRVPLTWGPSPVHPLPRITKQLNGANIWIKRDDCNSGLGGGGNKLRKLEYLVADALACGCDTLVTVGGVQSNHTRQVAAAAAATGMRAVLVQEHWVEWADAAYERVGNILISRLLGAEVMIADSGFDIGSRERLLEAAETVRARGGRPYVIPAGGSDHPLGGLGYVRFAHELADQEKEFGVVFDHVVVCSVTGSTQAGMMVGFAALQPKRAVIGIDASAHSEVTRSAVVRIANHTARLLDLDRVFAIHDVVLETRWAGDAYGIPTEETIAAMRMMGSLEGIVTDPVYEGKAVAAMIALVERCVIPRNANVLYVHLGGSPALHGYADLFCSAETDFGRPPDDCRATEAGG